MKKLKTQSVQTTITMLKETQAKKNDRLIKKVEKLQKNLVLLKKVSHDDLRLMTLFLLEHEFHIKLEKVSDDIEELCPGWRKLLDELTNIVPFMYADKEIDTTVGNNSRYVGILNFYELLKTEQNENFKEFTEMIHTLKTRALNKTQKMSRRREARKEKALF